MFRILGAVLAVAVVFAAAPTASAQLDLGTHELGAIDTLCIDICFTTGVGDCDAAGTLDPLSIAAPFSVRGVRRGPAAADLCNQIGQANPVNLPANVQPRQKIALDIQLVADQTGFFDEPLLIGDDPIIDVQAGVVPSLPCPASDPNALCLSDERFRVRGHWRTLNTNSGPAQVVQGVPSDNSGLFYFFNPNNWELLVKVLDGCNPTFDRFWVFYAATTDVEFEITVTDTQAQEVKVYSNPLGNPAAPIQDTQAFATCP